MSHVPSVWSMMRKFPGVILLSVIPAFTCNSMLFPFKLVPLQFDTVSSLNMPLWEHLWISFVWNAAGVACDCSWMMLRSWNLLPFIANLDFWIMAQGTGIQEYSGWRVMVMTVMARNFCTDKREWAGALLLCGPFLRLLSLHTFFYMTCFLYSECTMRSMLLCFLNNLERFCKQVCQIWSRIWYTKCSHSSQHVTS